MKKIYFVLLMLISGLSFSNEMDTQPIYKLTEVVELAKPYLLKEWKFDLDEWELVKVSFNYFGYFEGKDQKYDSGWVLTYKDRDSDINFSIWASNEKSPYFMMLK